MFWEKSYLSTSVTIKLCKVFLVSKCVQLVTSKKSNNVEGQMKRWQGPSLSNKRSASAWHKYLSAN